MIQAVDVSDSDVIVITAERVIKSLDICTGKTLAPSRLIKKNDCTTFFVYLGEQFFQKHSQLLQPL